MIPIQEKGTNFFSIVTTKESMLLHTVANYLYWAARTFSCLRSSIWVRMSVSRYLKTESCYRYAPFHVWDPPSGWGCQSPAAWRRRAGVWGGPPPGLLAPSHRWSAHKTIFTVCQLTDWRVQETEHSSALDIGTFFHWQKNPISCSKCQHKLAYIVIISRNWLPLPLTAINTLFGGGFAL